MTYWSLGIWSSFVAQQAPLPKVLIRNVETADLHIAGRRTGGQTKNMSDSIQFSPIEATELADRDCPLCGENMVEFGFRFTIESRPDEQLSGRCCLRCAAALLDAMRSLATSEIEDVVPDSRMSRCLSKYVN